MINSNHLLSSALLKEWEGNWEINASINERKLLCLNLQLFITFVTVDHQLDGARSHAHCYIVLNDLPSIMVVLPLAVESVFSASDKLKWHSSLPYWAHLKWKSGCFMLWLWIGFGAKAGISSHSRNRYLTTTWCDVNDPLDWISVDE